MLKLLTSQEMESGRMPVKIASGKSRPLLGGDPRCVLSEILVLVMTDFVHSSVQRAFLLVLE